MFAFHFEVWHLTAEDRTVELQGARLCGSRGEQGVGAQGQRPGYTKEGSEQWLLPQHQVPKRPKAGILEKLDCSPLLPNQSCVAITVKDWHVTPLTAGLSSGTGILGRGFQWCCKARTSPRDNQQLYLFVLPMGHGRKSQNFGPHLPSCV